MARPTKYKPEYIEEARKLCEGGATDRELAREFDVGLSTLYRWKVEFPEFREAIKDHKKVADERVERTLYEKALGYDYQEQQAIKLKKGQYEEEVEVVEVTKHQPSDTTAAIFWLKNRQPEDWRDKQEIEQSGELKIEIVKNFD